ncbi:kinase domain [Fusarium agapanthi]|uniref:Kinase domain n=1 Tax=Fusarium agapanthi TaxID=1803897 RepID=A0A9P5E759_9HYPO|nr:kinase domain [Fusarium agapanthi]
MWNLLEDISLFDRPAGKDGEYDAHVHLAQMVSLLGDPPEELIKRERIYREHQLKQPVMSSYGRACKTMNEFWGGPFFDDDNKILRSDLVGKGKTLGDTVTELNGDDKQAFLDFASGMLQWLPEKEEDCQGALAAPILRSFVQGPRQHNVKPLQALLSPQRRITIYRIV